MTREPREDKTPGPDKAAVAEWVVVADKVERQELEALKGRAAVEDRAAVEVEEADLVWPTLL